MIIDASIDMKSLQALSDHFKRKRTKYQHCVLVNTRKTHLEDLDEPSFTDVFQKPFDPKLLLTRISTLLKVYRPKL